MKIKKAVLSVGISLSLIALSTSVAAKGIYYSSKAYSFNIPSSVNQYIAKFNIDLNSLFGQKCTTGNCKANVTTEKETTQPEKTQKEVKNENNVNNFSEDVSQLEKEVFNLVNEERAKEGLSPLSWDSDLYRVAKAHSEDMAKNNYFSHTNLKGQSPFDRMKAFGITYKSAAENIAAGQKTAQSVMNSWMNSQGHRANIMSKSLTKIGVGLYKGGSYGFYWTQCFRS